jgi:uncharacterized protein (DUF779 family)
VASNVSNRVSATPEARAAIARLVAENGPIMFHTSGGRVGGRSLPICLPADALRLGARDHLLGEVEGVPVYEMEDKEGSTRCGLSAFVLDVARGPALGFSLAAAPGMRFTLRPVETLANGAAGRRDAIL